MAKAYQVREVLKAIDELWGRLMTEVADRYTCRVARSEGDEEVVGLCAEFGSIGHLDGTLEKAFAGIRKLVACSVRLLREEGKPVPEPPSLQRYSGTLTLRVPADTHRAVALDAADAGVSMNRLTVERLPSGRWRLREAWASLGVE